MGVECTKENPLYLCSSSCPVEGQCVSPEYLLCGSHVLSGLSHSDLAAWGLSSFPFPIQGGAEASILRGGEEPCLPPPPP